MALENVSFRRKLALVPTAVTGVCVLMLTAGLFVEVRGSHMFEAVAGGDLPALETSHHLGEELDAFQRALQDGVATEDPDSIDLARQHAATFEQLVGEAGRLAPDDAGVVSLADRFARYRDLAIATSRRLIETRDPQQLLPSVREMAAQYRTLRDGVRALTARRSGALKGSFGAALALQRRSALVAAAVAVACTALLFLIVSRIASDLVVRLDALARSASRIATEGDLAQPIDVSGRDEIGALGRAFAAMLEKLRTIPVTLQASVDELGGAAEALHACTREQLAALGEQERNVLALAAASSSVLQSGHQASSTARAALHTTAGTTRTADAGADSVRKSLAPYSVLHRHAEAALESVSALIERADRAEVVAGSIRTLSGQATNLAQQIVVSSSSRTSTAEQLPRAAAKLHEIADRTDAELTRIREFTAEVGRAARAASSRLEEGLRSTTGVVSRDRALEEYVREVGAMVELNNAAARTVLEHVDGQREAVEKLNGAVRELRDLVRICTQHVRTTTSSAATVRASADRIGGIIAGFKL